MRRLDWNALDEGERAAVLQRPVQAVSDEVRSGVQAIFDAVAARGDAALHEFTARFDGVALADFEVGEDEFARAAAQVPAAVQAAIDEAASRIEAFHRAGIAQPYEVETAPGLICRRVQRPIRRVGLYVPAGSADPAVLLAARQAPGVRVFTLGGAQAIAAMALGTPSVPRCDKLFGPGNAWVDEAKRQAAQRPGGIAIDMPAGPSEVLVVADAGADPAFVAADLLSQAEHGPDSQVLLLTDSDALLAAVAAQVEAQLTRLPRADIARRALEASRLVRVRDIAQAVAISDAYAPEHLILAVREPRAWLERIGNAGSIFLGDWTPEALGDYCSGSNHVLPTGGAARAWSGLSVASFQKAITVQEASAIGIANTGPCAATLALAEGLQAHARAVELRLERAA